MPKYTFKTLLKDLGLHDEFEAASSLPSQILGIDKKENDKSYKKYIKKVEYIESIYDINGEEVLYRFKEKTDVGKLMWGLIIALPSAIIYVFTHFSHWISTAADYTSDASGKDYVLKLIIWGLILCAIFVIPAFVNAARAKDTKSRELPPLSPTCLKWGLLIEFPLKANPAVPAVLFGYSSLGYCSRYF